MPGSKKVNKKFPVSNVQPDTVDFRDLFYVANLVEVPTEIPYSDFQKLKVPVLNQGRSSSCTGFALATAAHYLLRKRKVHPDYNEVSAEMLYFMARKYDDIRGENYEGSSCRAAMKAWFKHGICSEDSWPSLKKSAKKKFMTYERQVDAVKRPLGAYFRVNHKDIRAMHAALAEVGILYVSAEVHEGWVSVNKKTGEIAFDPANPPAYISGHAFVIIGYDSKGFFIQHSGGKEWGMNGIAKISYDDWLMNGYDCWVARLGAPIEIQSTISSSEAFSRVTSSINARVVYDLRPHLISIGNDGKLKKSGTFSNDEDEIKEIFTKQFRDITKNWSKKRLMFYAHGGLVNEDTALQRLLDYKDFCLKNEIYPLFFVWHTGIWETMADLVDDFKSGIKTEGFIDDAFNIVLDRIDKSIEVLVRKPGRMFWNEMKENALGSSLKDGGAYITMNILKESISLKNVEFHFAAHSAGSIFFANMIKYFCNNISNAETCTLWAPACTNVLFAKTYLPLINKKINRFSLFTLKDNYEQDDNCAVLYHKSLLYLVSKSFEDNSETGDIELTGMEKYAGKIPLIHSMGNDIYGKNCWIKSPDGKFSNTKSHGGFDDDDESNIGDDELLTSPNSTLQFIKGNEKLIGRIHFNRSKSSINKKRLALNITK